MVLNAGSLNRQVQVRRFGAVGLDEVGKAEGAWQNLGTPLFARRNDVSDGERQLAERWENLLVARFVVRATSFSKGIKRSDRLRHDGKIWEIDGIKEMPGSRHFLEITATTGVE